MMMNLYIKYIAMCIYFQQKYLSRNQIIRHRYQNMSYGWNVRGNSIIWWSNSSLHLPIWFLVSYKPYHEIYIHTYYTTLETSAHLGYQAWRYHHWHDKFNIHPLYWDIFRVCVFYFCTIFTFALISPHSPFLSFSQRVTDKWHSHT